MVEMVRIIEALLVLFLAAGVSAQVPPGIEGSDIIESALDQIRFDTPTRVEGRLLTLDPYDDAIWIDWTRIHDGGRWLLVPHDVQLLVYARDADMMELFRALPRGTSLRMTIQRGEDGKRRVLALEET